MDLDQRNRMTGCVGARRSKTHPGEHLVEADEWPSIASVLGLTGRELAVVVLLFRGKSRNTVARMLAIKPRTVRQYLEQIHEKLNIGDRIELVLRIIETRDMIRRQRAAM